MLRVKNGLYCTVVPCFVYVCGYVVILPDTFGRGSRFNSEVLEDRFYNSPWLLQRSKIVSLHRWRSWFRIGSKLLNLAWLTRRAFYLKPSWRNYSKISVPMTLTNFAEKATRSSTNVTDRFLTV